MCIIYVIVYFVFSFSYLKKLYAFETSRLSCLRSCLYFLLDNMIVTAQSTRQGYQCFLTQEIGQFMKVY